MSVKQIPLPDNTRRFMGRKRPLVTHPHLQLKNYMMKSLLSPPSQYGYAAQARAELHQMYLNDQLGDCVEAAIAHAVGMFGAQNDAKWIYTAEQITALYSAWGGYVPGNPSTDQGTDIQTALAGWQKNGAPGPGGVHKIVGSLAIDASNMEQVRTAIWLFENLILGMELPDAWVNPFPSASGFVWDVAGAPDPSNGHCVLATNYNSANIYIVSWAMNGVMTNAAFEEYCGASNGGEVYTVLSEDIINRAQAKAPNGFDWSQLLADFKGLE
jgi:hypothetical protein